MQCNSYTPVFYRSRDLNIDSSRFSWPLSYGEERSYNISNPQYTMNQYLCYEKEIVRKTIQNHEATFRYQVQELHQLYRRQQQLMDETRVKEIFMQHLPLQTSKSNNQEHITLHSTHSVSYNEPQASFFRNKGHEKGILDLELLADVHDDDQKEQFKEEKFSEGLPNFLFDLNAPAPMQLEEAKQESVVSLMAIDLNSLPLSYMSETASEIPLLPLKYSYKDEDDDNAYKTTSVDCIFGYDHAMRKKECVADDSAVDFKFDDDSLKVKTCIDLNSDELSPAEASSNDGIISGVEVDLEAPVSPENKEGPPPREKSQDIQLESNAANTLIMIASAKTMSVESFSSCLCWFAGIVSSAGDYLDELVTANCNDNSNGIDDFADNYVLKNEKEMDIQTRKRKYAGTNACKKATKYSSSDKKTSRSSSYSKVILQGWGKVRKREGGRRASSY